MLVISPIFLLSQNCVDFESLTLNEVYGEGYNTPGDIILTEANIDMSITNFELYSGPYFGNSWVISATQDFGTGKVLKIGNNNFLYDFTSLPYDVYEVIVEYAHFGGYENISVNGEPIYIGEITTFPDFPGLSIQVTQSSIPGGYKGYLVISGYIETLLLGGRELFIDNICAYPDAPNCIDFETLNIDEEFGNGINNQGDVIYTEDNVPISIEYFEWPSGGYFGKVKVISGFDGFGFSKVIWTANVNLRFDFTQNMANVTEVGFEFADLGGFENLSVNGSPVYVGELKDAPDPPGVTLNVNTVPMPGGEMGTAVLQGEIETLLVGGQEFFIDHICFFDHSGLDEPEVKQDILLGQNFPNPVKTTTRIPFKINRSTDVKVTIYNLMGQKVCCLLNDHLQAGEYKVSWNAENENGKAVTAGVYTYELKTENGIYLKKLMVVW